MNCRTFSTLNLKQSQTPPASFDDTEVDRSLISLLMSLRSCPTIMYTSNSKACKDISSRVSSHMHHAHQTAKHTFTSDPSSSVLIVVDRSADQVTPLKMPYHYQSMIYEHLDYHDGIASYTHNDKHHQLNLCELHDPFFSSRLFDHFGLTINKSVEYVKHMSNEHKKYKDNINTLEQLSSVAENLPEIQRRTNLSTKHYGIIEHITTLVKQHHLLDISKIEGEVIDSKIGLHTFDNVRQSVLSTDIRIADKIRLVIMYFLRNNSDPLKCRILCNDLEGFNVPRDTIDSIKKIVTVQSTNNSSTILDTIKQYLYDGDSHIQHIISSINKNKTDIDGYTCIGGGISKNKKYKLCVVYVVGGVGLDEAIDALNMKDIGLRTLVGGTHVMNTSMYVNQLLSL